MHERASGQFLTADDLHTLPDDGWQYELVRGEVVRMSPASYVSSVVAMTIGALLWAFIRPRNLGICATADGGMRLAADPDTVRAPDVSFVRAERLPAGGLKAGYFAGAPDLAVEVLSPTDRFSDVQRKVRDYLAAGTRLVWVIDPEARTAIVYRPDGRVTFLDEDGVLDGEDVVPDFSLALADVWVD